MNTTARFSSFQLIVAPCLAAAWAIAAGATAAEPAGEKAWRQVSGVYPHLAMFNHEGECGTGAVVPWADRLWAITYAPHQPRGSSDKLYEIDAALNQIVRPESIGGTPANRMIHPESRQLFIGPYAIDEQRRVRVIGPDQMLGRLTGNARHLHAPAEKIYFATMEEGFYEVDVKSLAVTELFADDHARAGRRANLPGYHGKGLASGQGRLVYANNGERSPEALRKPDIPSGCLAEWDGGEWRVVRRCQFTEVTGPGGIEGNARPETDPLWSIGWDHRSLILQVLEAGRWHAYRLPKASHAYDGAHGWNTEWPRIRDIGEKDLLMTMHGGFWRFPREFTAARSAGLAPRSTYLKVVGDFCRWQDRIVLGCDDTAKNEFLNKRKAKGDLAGPGQSQSNLWFVDPPQLDALGPALGRGAVWLDEPVAADFPSDPFLFAGFARRTLHLAHGAGEPVTFTLEVDARGEGTWSRLKEVAVPARGYAWLEFPADEAGAWIRLRASRDCPQATAYFHYAAKDERPAEPAAIFEGLARVEDKAAIGGLIRARGENLRTLALLAQRGDDGQVRDEGAYELDAALAFHPSADPALGAWMQAHVAIPRGVLKVEETSALFIDDAGRRWRLPKGAPGFSQPGPLGDCRVNREVCTERDLFHCQGTFYELPAENAGGFAKVRPIATHPFRIHDYCSYRGLLVLTGVRPEAAPSDHLLRSDDGQAAVWVGVVDDLWRLGKPRGKGGPWLDSPVQREVPSDPYLLAGYDRKSLALAHDQGEPVTIRLELDLSGGGLWREWKRFEVPPGQRLEERLPDALAAYWLRFVTDRPCRATAQLTYE